MSMAAVIKPAGAAAVRSLIAAPVRPAGDPRDATIAALSADRARLEEEVRALRGRLAQAATDARAAAEAAREEGHRAGLAAADVSEAERVSVIAAGVVAASATFEQRIAAMDGLAAALARACLDRVFERPEAMAAMVTDALAHRIATLRDQAALAVRVSGADFADTTAIEAAVRAAGGEASVTIDPDLPSGACRIAARLGRVECDVPGQWAALGQALEAMAAA